MGQGHLHNKEHSNWALAQEHDVQPPVHLHLINSLVHLLTSGIVIQRGVQTPSSITQPKFDGLGILGVGEETIQTPVTPLLAPF